MFHQSRFSLLDNIHVIRYSHEHKTKWQSKTKTFTLPILWQLDRKRCKFKEASGASNTFGNASITSRPYFKTKVYRWVNKPRRSVSCVECVCCCWRLSGLHWKLGTLLESWHGSGESWGITGQWWWSGSLDRISLQEYNVHLLNLLFGTLSLPLILADLIAAGCQRTSKQIFGWNAVLAVVRDCRFQHSVVQDVAFQIIVWNIAL